jgi:hypothetical protein
MSPPDAACAAAGGASRNAKPIAEIPTSQRVSRREERTATILSNLRISDFLKGA